jgi:hypothetical protein
VKHAEYMLAPRITRRNGDWEAYWATVGKHRSREGRKSEPANRITKNSSVIASLWIAPLDPA